MLFNCEDTIAITVISTCKLNIIFNISIFYTLHVIMI